MKVIQHYKADLLHIELPGCIVNVRAKLTNQEGREVTSIEILPDSECSGDTHVWRLEGSINNRLVKIEKVPEPTVQPS